MKKKQILAVLVIASCAALSGCSSKKEAETSAPETQAAPAKETAEAAEEVTEAAQAADLQTESEEMYLELVGAETEEDGWETEEDYLETEYDFWETESEYDFYFDSDETETEPEIIPRPEYDVADYLTIEDDAYLNMTVQVEPAQVVSDEEIDADIADSFYYLEDYDDLVVKKTEGTVSEGDTVNIDYEGKKDGEAFEGGTAEGYDLEIGSGSFIQGFEEGLIGKEIGSTVDLNLTFPEEYGVEELNGADVVFTVTINYVAQMPEITDEIAQKLSDGEYTTAEDYRESIRAELQSGYDEEYRDSVSGAVMQKLMELYPIEEYPQANVDYNKEMILSQYVKPYASMYGMTMEEFVETAYEMSYDDFESQQLIPSAQQYVAQEIILGAIAEKENITMTDEELQEKLKDYAEQYGVTVEDITYGQDMGNIRANELGQRVMNWLCENVTVETVSETEEETEEANVDFTETEADEDFTETEAEMAQTEA